MNIYKKTIKFFQDQQIAILFGLAGGIVGCVVGGEVHQYQAHFQQRSLPTIPKVAVEQVRPAAPENPPSLVALDESENVSSVASSEESSAAASSEPASSAPPESSAAASPVPINRPRLIVPPEAPAQVQESFVASSEISSEQSSSFRSVATARSDDSGIVAAEPTSESASSIIHVSSSAPPSNATASASAAAASQPPATSQSGDFPAMGNAVHPVARVPNWGAMRTPDQWNRTYAQMRESDFVAIPKYIAGEQTIPMAQLRQTRTPENERMMTAKLYYSTDYCGSYDLDAGEFTGVHCALDLKLPLGTPIGSVAGGRVQYTGSDARLGLHVIVEHHSADGVFFSIYAHLGTASVRAGQDVTSGQVIGTVGMTGETSAPHLHFQIDRKQSGESVPHQPYVTAVTPGPATAAQFTINPIEFIQKY